MALGRLEAQFQSSHPQWTVEVINCSCDPHPRTVEGKTTPETTRRNNHHLSSLCSVDPTMKKSFLFLVRQGKQQRLGRSTITASLITTQGRTMSSLESPATNNNNNNNNNKKPRVDWPRSETVNFDPTSMGLPAGWKLTSFSELKG